MRSPESALRKEPFRSPALQNGALLHNRLFMDLGAMQTSGTVLKVEGVDGLSRETARARRASESLPALQRVVMAEATRRLGSPISLDLFATANNMLVPRFFARHPELLAQEADALAQQDWGRSRCRCGLMHRECVFAVPPRGILPDFVAKARADGMRGSVGSSSSRSRHLTRHGQLSRPPRSRPSTDRATRASSCPTLQRTSGRAMTSTARSAWLSWLSTLAGGPACVSGGSRLRVAGTQSAGLCSRFRASWTPRTVSAPLRRSSGSASPEDAGEGRLHNVVTRLLTRSARSLHTGWHCNVGRGFRPLGLGWDGYVVASPLPRQVPQSAARSPGKSARPLATGGDRPHGSRRARRDCPCPP